MVGRRLEKARRSVQVTNLANTEQVICNEENKSDAGEMVTTLWKLPDGSTTCDKELKIGEEVVVAGKDSNKEIDVDATYDDGHHTALYVQTAVDENESKPVDGTTFHTYAESRFTQVDRPSETFYTSDSETTKTAELTNDDSNHTKYLAKFYNPIPVSLYQDSQCQQPLELYASNKASNLTSAANASGFHTITGWKFSNAIDKNKFYINESSSGFGSNYVPLNYTSFYNSSDTATTLNEDVKYEVVFAGDILLIDGPNNTILDALYTDNSGAFGFDTTNVNFYTKDGIFSDNAIACPVYSASNDQIENWSQLDYSTYRFAVLDANSHDNPKYKAQFYYPEQVTLDQNYYVDDPKENRTSVDSEGLNFYTYSEPSMSSVSNESITENLYANGDKISNVQVNNLKYYTDVGQADLDGIDDSYYEAKFKYTMQGAVDPSQISIGYSPATYLSQRSLSRNGANSGVELKLAYFHDLGHNLMAGLDFSGTVSQRNTRNVSVSQLNIKPVEYPDLTIMSKIQDGGHNNVVGIAVYNNSTGGYDFNQSQQDTHINVGQPLTIAPTNDQFKSAIRSANPGMAVSVSDPGIDYVDTSDGSKDLSFEKGIFTPKLAFVVGGTLGGWFAGVRTGVSYMTGKVKTHDMTNYKNVSISSPFVGVHVMKQLNDNVHMYMTADWNVGDGRKPVHMNGIKSFKQSSYNVSAGVTWRIKTGK